jgi:predicted RNA binding protein YcfA (HicA-like mRNA interferase family)
MSREAKLTSKLLSGAISARELRALLEIRGWRIDRTRGSHEFWVCGPRTFVLATHGKDLKRYQIKQAQQALLFAEKKNGKEEDA